MSLLCKHVQTEKRNTTRPLRGSRCPVTRGVKTQLARNSAYLHAISGEVYAKRWLWHLRWYFVCRKVHLQDTHAPSIRESRASTVCSSKPIMLRHTMMYLPAAVCVSIQTKVFSVRVGRRVHRVNVRGQGRNDPSPSLRPICTHVA